MQGIYQIRNKANDKRYIGSSNDIEKRWEEHKRALVVGGHCNIHFQRAWNKYGEEGFAFELVEDVSGGKEVRLTQEQGYLDKGFSKGVLYNIATKASGGCDARSGETRAKISKALMGRELSTKCKAKIGKAHKGKKISDEQKAKLSRALMGRKFSEEHKARIGKSQLAENNSFYGKHHTEETRIKMSRAHGEPYPAFYNVKAGEYIPAGHNLFNLCRRQDLGYWPLYEIKRGVREQSQDGWRVIKGT